MDARRPHALAGAVTAELELAATETGTELRLAGTGLCFDHSFLRGELARRSRQSDQALLRACNNRLREVKSVLDTTAGWGADALTLARHGYRVTMVEREPRVRQVLRRALDCLRRDDAALGARLRLVETDAGAYLAALGPERGYDCIYIDPMFPVHKSGAKPGKAMQILQAVAGNHHLEPVFEAARRAARRRVVVKRPAKAPPFAGRDPDLVYRERSIRFDVYVTAGAADGTSGG